MTITDRPVQYRTNAAAAAAAAEIRAAAVELGVTVSARGSVVTAVLDFPVGDRAAYAAAEDACLDIIARFPASGGSTWGTTSDGVGGLAAIKSGRCRINVSGVPLRLARQFADAPAPSAGSRKAAAITATVDAIEGEPGECVSAAVRRHLAALYDRAVRDARGGEDE